MTYPSKLFLSKLNNFNDYFSINFIYRYIITEPQIVTLEQSIGDITLIIMSRNINKKLNTNSPAISTSVYEGLKKIIATINNSEDFVDTFAFYILHFICQTFEVQRTIIETMANSAGEKAIKENRDKIIPSHLKEQLHRTTIEVLDLLIR